MSVQRILGWIEGVQKKGDTLTAAELHHNIGGKVERFAFTEGMSALDLAQALFSAAVEDSEGYPGLECVYAIIFYGPDGSENYLSRKQFRYSAVASADRAEFSASEPPNETGQASMLMRHIEGTMRINERMCTNILADAAGREARLQLANDRANEAQLNLLALMRRQALDAAALELQREERREAALMRTFLIDQAQLLGPVLLGGLLKSKSGSVAEKERLEDLRTNPPSELTLVLDFIATLTPEQYTRLGLILTPLQAGNLLALRQGEVPKEIVGITVARIAQSFSDTQVSSIWEIVKDSPTQIEAFRSFFALRANTFAFQRQQVENEASAEAIAPPVPDPPMANPANGNGKPG